MKKRFAFIPMLVAFVFALALSACGGASAEDLIRADLESYFGDPENAAEEFASGLEESAGDELDMLGITEDEFTEAYLEGFAYEIGEITVDGDTATAEQANEVCEEIRTVIRKLYGARVARSVTILYGGSMNENNAHDLLAQPDVDGGLIGGASLVPKKFTEIINAANQE